MTQSATGQKVFGAGYFYGIPTTSNPTPTQFLTTQNMSADFKRELKYLYGSDGQSALDIATGKLTISGKVEIGSLNSRALNDLILGTSLASGSIAWARNEPGTVPASSTYTVTVANDSEWATDLGVRYDPTQPSTANKPLTRVASVSAAGQYSCAAGVYTFDVADASAKVLISYTYTVSASGQEISMTNQPMGKTGNFQAVMALPFGTEQNVIQFNNCMSGGLSIATKLDDYVLPSFEFGAAADANNIIGTFSTAEVS